MNYIGGVVALLGAAFAGFAIFYQKYGIHGAVSGGPYLVTLTISFLGLIAGILIALKRYRFGGWLSIAVCIAGAFSALELWLAPGSFFLVSGLIGFTNARSTVSSRPSSHRE